MYHVNQIDRNKDPAWISYFAWFACRFIPRFVLVSCWTYKEVCVDRPSFTWTNPKSFNIYVDCKAFQNVESYNVVWNFSYLCEMDFSTGRKLEGISSDWNRNHETCMECFYRLGPRQNHEDSTTASTWRFAQRDRVCASTDNPNDFRCFGRQASKTATTECL